MTTEDLEKLKKDHDYCIIPIKNIVGIDDINPILNDNFMVLKVKPSEENGNIVQFVNSDYFRTWGTKFEETNDKVVNALLGEVKEVEDD